MKTRICQVCIKCSMCDLISDIIICCVWSWDIGKIKACDKIMFKNQKKRKYGNKRYFYINLHLKDCLDIEFKACIITAGIGKYERNA